MISLTWFDLVAVGILIFFTMRGAVKGVVFQLASLAGIALCFIFANAISQAAGPYVHLEPPLNNWVIFAASYLGFTFICYLVARTMDDWLQKNKLKDFDRHLGAIFGLVKGVALVLVLTFFVVTMSASAREALKGSYTGKYAAIIMDKLHAVMPERLHSAVEDYIHLLDGDHLDLDAHKHDHSHASQGQGSDSPFGLPSPFPPIPNSQTSAPSPIPLGSNSNTGSNFWTQLQGLLSNESQRVVNEALQSSDPQTRTQIEQGLQSLMKSVPEKDRAALQQQISQVGASQLKQFLDWKLSTLTAPIQPAPIPTSPTSLPQPTQTQIPGMLPTANLAAKRAEQMRTIAAAYSPAAAVQQNIELDITQRTAGIPDNVVVAALDDWIADLQRRVPDPDPQTTQVHPVEIRIVRQLQVAGMRVEQLSLDVQQRLRGVQAPASSSQQNPL
ncbi:CvpA family protein [Planctomicrobium sp. SH527]|uniref:CvpA family protein n=1 Tax=Planctomicrobium sp. SH527 TaxID=3448123 RepID=UPI003F5C198D